MPEHRAFEKFSSDLEPVSEKNEVSLETWKKFHCVECDRDLNGEKEWSIHLGSRTHRYMYICVYISSL